MKNDDKKAIDILVRQIISAANNPTDKPCYDRTFKSTVWGKNPDGTYQINYLGQMYHVPNALGNDLSLGQTVWVKIPGGVFRHMHICGFYQN